jgi:hypothetical protein
MAVFTSQRVFRSVRDGEMEDEEDKKLLKTLRSWRKNCEKLRSGIEREGSEEESFNWFESF